MRFLKNALSTLNKIYKFESGTVGVDQLDLVSPIQLVHDTSRQAELAAIVTDPAACGFVQIGQDNVHAAGGETVEGVMSPYSDGTLVPAWGIDPSSVWIWLMQLAGSASGTTIMGANSEASLTLNVAALGGALVRRDFGVIRWSTAVTIGTSLSATFPAALSVSQATAAMQVGAYGTRLPMLIPFGSTLTWRTVATAAVPGTIRVQALAWVGPVGVYPPGFR